MKTNVHVQPHLPPAFRRTVRENLIKNAMGRNQKNNKGTKFKKAKRTVKKKEKYKETNGRRKQTQILMTLDGQLWNIKHLFG